MCIPTTISPAQLRKQSGERERERETGGGHTLSTKSILKGDLFNERLGALMSSEVGWAHTWVTFQRRNVDRKIIGRQATLQALIKY